MTVGETARRVAWKKRKRTAVTRERGTGAAGQPGMWHVEEDREREREIIVISSCLLSFYELSSAGM